MTKSLRGINLGGWLIAERWMTPQLFDGVTGEGERSLGRSLGREEAAVRLKQHRDSFITEDDFRWIKQHGFDVVRLPVGYWLLEESPGYITGVHYVDHAFRWAEKHGLKIILDFHGLQGSQNGLEHSGETGSVRAFRRPNRQQALETLRHLCERYGYKPSLIGIEIINEPKLNKLLWPLMRYYDKAIEIAKHSTRSGVKIIVSDAFQPLRLARVLAKRNYGPRLVLDVHLYQIYSAEDRQMSFEEHLGKVERQWRELLSELHRLIPGIMIGEWSAALPSEMYQRMSEPETQYAKQYFDAQQQLYDRMSWAHCYWSYQAPSAGVWGYRSSEFLHSL